MKIFHFFMALSCLFCLSAKAQTTSETVTYNKFGGGSFKLSTNKGTSAGFVFQDFNYLFADWFDSRTKLTTISFSPTFGKQTSEKTIIGFAPNIDFFRAKSAATNFSQEESLDITQFRIGFFVRQQLKSLNRFSLAIEPAINFGVGNYKISGGFSSSTETKINYVLGDIQLTPILSYMVSPRFRLLGRIGNMSYSYSKVNSEEADEIFDSQEPSHSVNINYGLQSIRFGGEFLF